MDTRAFTKEAVSDFVNPPATSCCWVQEENVAATKDIATTNSSSNPNTIRYFLGRDDDVVPHPSRISSFKGNKEASSLVLSLLS